MKRTGRDGETTCEDLAARRLADRQDDGCSRGIGARSRLGEIDIVARDGDAIVVC
ncbi:hypothetical protein [Streptomyces sp. KL116D]|uniref:hypothetical protein n=1 Tax=Streptomyces sp. KL116D TaxID=3045152 RepID=UPI0035592BE2